MASWTTPVTHANGDILAVSDWNGVANNETFLYQAPYAYVYDSAGTTVAANATQTISLGGTVKVGYGCTLSSNTVHLSIAGIYHVSFSVGFTSGFDSQFVAILTHNGSTAMYGVTGHSSYFGPPTPPGVTNGSGIIVAAASDTLGLQLAAPTAGGTTTVNSANATFICVSFVGSQ